MKLIESNRTQATSAPQTPKLSAPLKNSNANQQGLAQVDSFSNDGNGLDPQLTQFKRLAQNSGRSGHAIVFGGNHSDGKQAQHLKTWSLSTDSNGVNGYSNPPSDLDFRPEIKTRKVKRKRNQPSPEKQAAPTTTPSKPKTTSKAFFKPEPINRFKVLPKPEPIVEAQAPQKAAPVERTDTVGAPAQVGGARQTTALSKTFKTEEEARIAFRRQTESLLRPNGWDAQKVGLTELDATGWSLLDKNGKPREGNPRLQPGDVLKIDAALASDYYVGVERVTDQHDNVQFTLRPTGDPTYSDEQKKKGETTSFLHRRLDSNFRSPKRWQRDSIFHRRS